MTVTVLGAAQLQQLTIPTSAPTSASVASG